MLTTQQKNALSGLAQRHGWYLLVLFGSVARGKEGGDIDLAIMPADKPDVIKLGRWQRELEVIVDPTPVDLVVIQPGMSPLTRFQALWHGVCLFEAREGLFEQEQNRAFRRQADARVWLQHNADVRDG